MSDPRIAQTVTAGVLAAQHTWTAACDGLHAPGPCPPSPTAPVYAKVRQDDTSNLWLITCDEGWRSLIVATGMYEPVADWLLGLIGRSPFPGGAR